MSENRNESVQNMAETLKAYVKKGNIARIRLVKDGNKVLDLPLNAGIAGAVIGLAHPWTLIASAIATLGFDCQMEMVKTDGTVVTLMSRDLGHKAASAGYAFVDGIRNAMKSDG
ncbi:MAG: DUF4342 domain-containing protein [Clostridia bacterium]|nr:DUF4342 domain-containing protein [Clostridia bacterium]